jgi:hypothetical protein
MILKKCFFAIPQIGSFWGPHMGIPHGDPKSGSHMVTPHGEPAWGPHMGTPHEEPHLSVAVFFVSSRFVSRPIVHTFKCRVGSVVLSCGRFVRAQLIIALIAVS